jgi:UDPglucose--hexose-1-phosphate uridylyltransferase
MKFVQLTKADGRSLTLYSRTRVAVHGQAPSPDPEPHSHAGHLRWQPLRGEWVAYAPRRQGRTFLPPAAFNPLLPTRDPAHPTELPQGEYDIAVFDNLFPALSMEAPDPPSLFVDTATARGKCEVVVFTQDPDTSLGRLPLEHIALLFEVWAHRTSIHAEAGLQYVLPFENRGVEVGVTLHHPHGQIYSYPITPPVPLRMNAQESAYFKRTGRGLLATLLDEELDGGERVLYAGAQAVAFVPAWARYAYEVWIAPRRPVPDFSSLDSESRLDLARALKTVLLKYDGLWNRPFPYVMAWFQAPFDGGEHPESHLHAEFYPPFRSPEKLKYLAGTELAAGLFASDTLPEDTARQLQAVRVETEH